MDEQLEAHEDFFGFYNIPDIGAETIVSAVKDVLLKLQSPTYVHGRIIGCQAQMNTLDFFFGRLFSHTDNFKENLTANKDVSY